jgi:hypothetical protein
VLDAGGGVAPVLLCDGKSDVILDGITVRRSGMAEYGGGLDILNDSENITVRECSFRENQASRNGGGPGGYANGGAILCYGGSRNVTIENCTVESNSGPYGGGINVNNSVVTILNSVLRNNTSESGGGGPVRCAGYAVRGGRR